MWNQYVFGIEFYKVFYFFMIYCVVGWIWESSYCSINARKLINRGFLNGPIIPIYGSGATVIYLTFYNPTMISLVQETSVKNIAIIFGIGMVAATILEYVTSYVMEKMFHAKWWDYSDEPLNLQGRICFHVSLFWGLLSVLMVKLLHPRVELLVAMIPRKAGEIAGVIIMALFLVDFTVTVIATVQLDKKITAMHKIREEFIEFAEGLKLYETKEELKARLAKLRLGDFVEQGKNWYQETVGQKLAEVGSEKIHTEAITHRMEEVENKLRDVFARYKNTTMDFFQRMVFHRLFNAFPTMTFKGREEAMLDLKERLITYRQNFQKKDR